MKMTLNEAIIHAEEVAEAKSQDAELSEIQGCYNNAKKCVQCAEEHKQLAKWLKDYKRLLEQELCDSEIIYCKDCKFTDGKGPIADGRYWCTLHPGFMDFCSDAERKIDGNGRD